MTDSSAQVQILEQKLAEKMNALDQAIDKANQNIIHDIQGMDREVAEICQDIVNLPTEEALKLEEKMTTMIGKLEELAAALEDYQQRAKN